MSLLPAPLLLTVLSVCVPVLLGALTPIYAYALTTKPPDDQI